MAQSFGSVPVASQDLDAVRIVVKQPQERQLGALCMNKVQERARGQIRISFGLLESARASRFTLSKHTVTSTPGPKMQVLQNWDEQRDRKTACRSQLHRGDEESVPLTSFSTTRIHLMF